MIDTHCHILPGLDDGAPDEETALAMVELALADGVETIIATPHMREGDYLNERKGVLEALESFRELLVRKKLPLRLEAGSEVHLAPHLSSRIANERLLTYGDHRAHLLLECPYRTRPVRLRETIFELMVAGITPVIAHPERIRHFQDDIDRYEEVVLQGALGQLTSSSLCGVFGKRIQALSESMIRRRLVHVLGSDAHDTTYRPPVLSEARKRWADIAGEESAELATSTWPRALIHGESFDAGPPVDDPKPRGFFSRLFR